jgi:hypothetical protein
VEQAAALPVLPHPGWAIWSGLGFGDPWGLVWWIANGVWGLSYLAATYVAYDQED